MASATVMGAHDPLGGGVAANVGGRRILIVDGPPLPR